MSSFQRSNLRRKYSLCRSFMKGSLSDGRYPAASSIPMDTPLIRMPLSTSAAGYTETESIQQMNFCGASTAVIGMVSQDCQRSINLFGEHHAHQKMRPGLRAECEPATRFDRRSGI